MRPGIIAMALHSIWLLSPVRGSDGCYQELGHPESRVLGPADDSPNSLDEPSHGSQQGRDGL